MTTNKITVINSRVHNLKNVSCEIPKKSFTVVTGPSGSGKSSLVFDTIFKEGQRRFFDSLSSYARFFLGQPQAPDVDMIEGLSPSIAIEQKTSLKNPRSTVGTLTEIYDYLRVLYVKFGNFYCPDSGEKIISHTPSQIVREVEKLGQDKKIILSAPFSATNPEELKQQISKYQAIGLMRGMVNQTIYDFESSSDLQFCENDKHAVVVDRLIIKDNFQKRFSDSLELALRLGNGVIHIHCDDRCLFFSTKNISPVTLKTFPTIDTRTFSFNSPHGACLACKGMGVLRDFDENLLVIDPSFSLDDGAVKAIGSKNSLFYRSLLDFLERNNLNTSTPIKNFTENQLQAFFYGEKLSGKITDTLKNTLIKNDQGYPGLINWLRKKHQEQITKNTKNSFSEFLTEKTCHFCQGQKLNNIALSIKIENYNITELCSLSVKELQKFISQLKLNPALDQVSKPLINNINKRCGFLNDVGLDYLDFNRQANTLSGGELQRIRMANQLGSSLSGVLYVLDEPSVGLHPKDNAGLIQTFLKLRDNDNTVIVIEHDLETIKQADYILDLGPGAGNNGGKIIASGTIDEVKNCQASLTGQYLCGVKRIIPSNSPRPVPNTLHLKGANLYNIQNIDVTFPLNSLVCITGVSGSGKTTLLNEILIPALNNHLSRKKTLIHSNYHSLKGASRVDSVIYMDQGPIGKSSQSNPATFCGFFDEIRNLFANTTEAKIRGYDSTRFSFNSQTGRCNECEGQGVIKIEMHYMPDVYLTCEECNGQRYNQETLTVLYKTKNIAEILDMSINEACEFFKNHPKINRQLDMLVKVGLGYMKLGQPAPTLSGGEAQRLKIARELSKKKNGHILYILDEPTTGLHIDDTRILLKLLNELVDQDNSVFIIEHNLDIIKCADYIIDMGPGGGINGGKIVACGTPQEVSMSAHSYTGQYLKNFFQ